MVDINESFNTSGSDVELPTTTTGAFMTTSQEAIYHRLRLIVSEHLGVRSEEVTLGKRFEEDFGADSLDMAELIIAVEDEFELADIEDAVRYRVSTVEDAVTMIENAAKRESTNA